MGLLGAVSKSGKAVSGYAARGARSALRASRRVLMASLAVNVLLAAVVASVLAPGGLFDYSGPGLLPKMIPGGRVGAPQLKFGLAVSLALGLLDVGVGAILDSFLKSLL